MAQSNPLLRQVTPLSDEQLDALERLVEPLSRDQVVWIGGYLAGIAATRRGMRRGRTSSTSHPTIRR